MKEAVLHSDNSPCSLSLCCSTSSSQILSPSTMNCFGFIAFSMSSIVIWIQAAAFHNATIIQLPKAVYILVHTGGPRLANDAHVRSQFSRAAIFFARLVSCHYFSRSIFLVCSLFFDAICHALAADGHRAPHSVPPTPVARIISVTVGSKKKKKTA